MSKEIAEGMAAEDLASDIGELMKITEALGDSETAVEAVEADVPTEEAEPVIHRTMEEPEVEPEPEPVVETVPSAEILEDSPVEPTPVEAEPVVEPDAMTVLTEQNAALLAQVNEMAAQMANGVQPVAPVETPPATPAAVEQVQTEAVAPAQPAVEDYTTGNETLNFFGSQEELAEHFKTHEGVNRVFTAAHNHTIKTITQAIPNIVQSLVAQQFTLKSSVEEFFTKNEDLRAVRPFVSMATNKAHAANPTATMPEILEIAGNDVRTRLKLAQKAKAEGNPAAVTEIMTKGVEDKPGFTPSGARSSRKGAAPKLSTLEQELGELMTGM